MLPRLAAALPKSSPAIGLSRRVVAVSTTTSTPCQNSGAFLDEGADAHRRAAALCAACPLVDACLADALTVDAAYAQGRDLYGISGVCGGIVFDPDFLPRRPGHPRTVRHRRSAA